MAILLAEELLSAAAALWRAKDVAMPVLALPAGIAGAWLHFAHPPSSEHEQDAVLAALLIL
ncbi:hypothetical protein [Siccirubricoccus sp. G192]|uniref:hypothetical protein n=1 Tax=Siccirubricoccus sp. G192 TaxID=2849651 RepID=UPI001C2CB455|nr:hypothetical protein [Siccirubricoccus sp. G192]MBV1796608.1 hypothetical protein [Siccirubricoccus sp. G192]